VSRTFPLACPCAKCPRGSRGLPLRSLVVTDEELTAGKRTIRYCRGCTVRWQVTIKRIGDQASGYIRVSML